MTDLQLVPTYLDKFLSVVNVINTFSGKSKQVSSDV